LIWTGAREAEVGRCIMGTWSGESCGSSEEFLDVPLPPQVDAAATVSGVAATKGESTSPLAVKARVKREREGVGVVEGVMGVRRVGMPRVGEMVLGGSGGDMAPAEVCGSRAIRGK